MSIFLVSSFSFAEKRKFKTKIISFNLKSAFHSNSGLGIVPARDRIGGRIEEEQEEEEEEKEEESFRLDRKRD